MILHHALQWYMNICETCEKEFTPSRNSGGRFCSRECFGLSIRKRKTVECPNCGTPFEQKLADSKFCSGSCAAKYNNSKSPKRIPQGTCVSCKKENTVRTGRKYCSDCWMEIKRTLSEEKESKTPRVRNPSKVPCKCGRLKKRDSLLCKICHEESKPTYEDWLSGKWSGAGGTGLMSSRLRKMIMDNNNWTCQSPTCPVPGGFSKMVNPVTGLVPLEIDHINGNAHDHSPENIIVLCPTCHALTPTYRSLNKNSVRRRNIT